MNQTKKLTQGAMMLAIIGALILVDRVAAYFFTELIVLLIPVVIIMYSTMHTLSDGMILSVGMIIISFLLGNFQFTYLIYVPVGIVTGLAYSYGIKRNLDKRTLLVIAIATYVLGELIATFVVYPLLGFPVDKMISEYKLALGESGSLIGFDYASIFTAAGLDFNRIIVIVFMLSTVFLGLMEGVLIHLLSIFILKRFKIKDLGNIDIWNMKPNKVVAYVCMLCLFLLFFVKDIKNQTLYYICVSIALVAGMILMYYGYIFLILFGRIVLKRNVGGLIVMLFFLVPVFLSALVGIGFLYAAGPLRAYLESKVQV